LGSAAAAAKSVAPPGYSEHHTGYAVDLADANQDFLDFGNSPAFRWMRLHAHEFGFELSFPHNNRQGVDYEPWHWRFVGSPQAAKTFELAEELQQK
jgi:zinc D-Ala-D-Ala carboxypeptidase